jgi:hypothetical protein
MIQVLRERQRTIPGERESLSRSGHGQTGGHEKGADAHERPNGERSVLAESLVVNISQRLTDGAVIDCSQIGTINTKARAD